MGRYSSSGRFGGCFVLLVLLSGLSIDVGTADDGKSSPSLGSRNSAVFVISENPKTIKKENTNVTQQGGTSSHISSSLMVGHTRSNRSTRALVRVINPSSKHAEDPIHNDVLVEKFRPFANLKVTSIIPYLRPGRSLELQSSMADEDDSSPMDDDDSLPIDSDDDNDKFQELRKRGGDSMIPMMRVGREKPGSSRKYSMIPSLRVGKSVVETENSDIDSVLQLERRDTMIPMMRVGRLPKVDSLKKWKFRKSKGRLTAAEEMLEADPNYVKVYYSRPGRIVSDMNENGASALSDDYEPVEDDADIDEAYVQDGEDSLPALTEVESDRVIEDLSRADVEYPLAERKSDEIISQMSGSNTDLVSDVNIEHDLRYRRQLIPQVRFGRADSDKNKSMKPKVFDFILPYPRPGRDQNLKISKINSKYELDDKHPFFMIPNTRPGRSQDVLRILSDETLGESKRQGYMTPVARLGRDEKIEELSLYSQIPSTRIKRSEELDVDDVLHHNNQMLSFYPKLSAWAQKYSPQEYKERLLKYGEDAAIFLIPYPRPGKRSILNINDEDSFQTSECGANKSCNEQSDSMLEETGFENEEVMSDLSIGLDHVNSENSKVSETDIFDKRDSKSLNKLLTFTKFQENSNSKLKAKTSKVPTFDFVLPYPRPGRDSNTSRMFMIPYARLGKNSNSLEGQYLSSNSRRRRTTTEPVNQNFIVPYPRPGRSDDVQNAVAPHLIPGRSQSPFILSKSGSRFSNKDMYIVPYPRPGRSKNVPDSSETTKYISKEKFILPYPRPGRSKPTKLSLPPSLKDTFIVPYPRPGRSKSFQKEPQSASLKSNKNIFALPYPRPGRSTQSSIVPYPRTGRSGQSLMVPYPRPGRSGAWSMVPYPRPGRSSQSSMVPYPRPGRFSQSPMVPYPRPRRSGQSSMVPYPRPGRSSQSSMVPHPRPGRSGEWSMVPYPRPGRSRTFSVLPYPRPGRSSQYSVVPYPRPGRSDQGREIEFLRPYRAENNSTNQDDEPAASSNQNTVIPYPRLGRAEKIILEPNNEIDNEGTHNLDKHILIKGNSKYMVPYPRPGRYS